MVPYVEDFFVTFQNDFDATTKFWPQQWKTELARLVVKWAQPHLTLLAADGYVPYGPEWEREMMKLKKIEIIRMLAAAKA